MGEGFARAFLSDAHIAALGKDKRAFWRDLAQRCEAAGEDARIGTQEFAVLQFKRGGVRVESDDWVPGAVREIGFPG